MKPLALAVLGLALAGALPAQAAAPLRGVGLISVASTGQFGRTRGLSPRVLRAAPQAAPLARVQVVALEFEYRLSRLRLRPGPARIELVNLGQDEHDLSLRRVGGTKTYALGKVLPGGRRVLSTRLRPGRYHLWCSLADHAARGMQANLRVVARG